MGCFPLTHSNNFSCYSSTRYAYGLQNVIWFCEKYFGMRVARSFSTVAAMGVPKQVCPIVRTKHEFS